MSSKKLRKNDEIRANVVLVVDEDERKLGNMPLEKAIGLAKEKELDLVEVSPKSEPPVCKIMDYGHHLYRQKKAERKQKVLSKARETKEIRFGIRISDHDLEVRTKRARKFLEKGHPVKILLQFRGREASHPEIGLKHIEEMIEALSDVAKPEGEIKRRGRNISLEIRPLPHGKKNSDNEDTES